MKKPLSPAPLFVFDAEGITAALPGEGNPTSRLTWEQIDAIKADIHRKDHNS